MRQGRRREGGREGGSEWRETQTGGYYTKWPYVEGGLINSFSDSLTFICGGSGMGRVVHLPERKGRMFEDSATEKQLV